LVRNNPDGANEILKSYGYPPAETYEELLEALYILQHTVGDSATIDLLKEHPDFDIISETYKYANSKMLNASGDENPIQQTQPQQIIIPQTQAPVSSGNEFGSLMQNVILAIMAFWLINKIISKEY
jgi:hypothetical protein